MRHWIKIALGSASAALLLILAVPIPEQVSDHSLVLYDAEGQLLSARIATDEQWRFPLHGDIPKMMETCILLYEDEYFHLHPGFNPVSIIKALNSNLKAGRIVRGGSTITMQVMRMARGNRTRTIGQKLIEVLGALKLELFYSKKEILHMWATMAPFGGNTVGASTAAWRYYQRALENLSIAEYATLAVLPNSPSRVHLGRGVDTLTQRRNRLLNKLYQRDIIDDTSLQLALEEDVPDVQLDLPQVGLPFLQFCHENHPHATTFNSTLDPAIQETCQGIIDHYSKQYQIDGINHAACLIIDNKTNQVKAYVGNSQASSNEARYVDCIQAPRSYGSLLKPFLYAKAIDDGYFLPYEKVKDIPTNINGFIPKNFDRQFRGQVTFSEMVSQSLNVPAVRTLNYIGIEPFHNMLTQNLGLKHINSRADHHGLSIILGGGEASLWEMGRLYKGLAQNAISLTSPFSEVQYLGGQIQDSRELEFEFGNESIDHTLEAMASLERPLEEQNFAKYHGVQVAWKTGTSYGHRDAWAIGATPEYTVAVWVGNENGEGIYDLTGAKKAAPILFKIFGAFNGLSEFPPIQNNGKLKYCLESGQLIGGLCTSWSSIPSSANPHKLRQCNSHVLSRSIQSEDLDTTFVLDPVVKYYHDKYFGMSIQSETPIQNATQFSGAMRIVYPGNNSILFIPKKLNNTYTNVNLLAHVQNPADKLYWYLDGLPVGSTVGSHEINLDLEIGEYELFVVNQNGNEDAVFFEVVKRKVP